MANSMTKAQFTLIEDAVNEGIEKYLEFIDERGFWSKTESPSRATLERMLRKYLADAFASRLRYTNDNFDSNKFRRAITKIP